MQTKAIPPHLRYNPSEVQRSQTHPEAVAAGAEVRAGEFEIICKSCKKLDNGCSPRDNFTECPVPENYDKRL
jgi:hypothetical protein